MIRITEDEEQELRSLYETANAEDTPAALNNIRVYYKKLGTKYKFNPLRVTINTKGEVKPITKENVFIVTSIKGEVLIVTRSKVKALEIQIEMPSHQMKEVPLE